MANTQYIGARYVVKIYQNKENPSTADWDSYTHYEPLVMVTYNYNTYLSRKDVPATVGNPAENSDYWVQTGFYNGQISELQRLVDDLNSALATEKAERTAADTSLSNLIGANYNSLINKITEEATARASSDTALDERITTNAGNISTLGTNLNSEISARANADELLQNQIDEIIAPSGEAPSSAEVENARIGADGITYNTLGNAIRTQITNVSVALDDSININDSLSAIDTLSRLNYVQGSISGTGAETEITSRIRSDFIYVNNVEKIGVIPASGYKYFIAVYDEDKQFVSETNWGTDTAVIDADMYYIRFVVANSSDTDITVAEGSNLSIHFYSYRNISEDVLNNKIEQVANNVTLADEDSFVVSASDFELGGYTTDGHTLTAQSRDDRIRTKITAPLKLHVGDYIYLKDYTNMHFYVDEVVDTTVTNSGWYNDGKYAVKTTADVYLMIEYKDYSAVASIADVVSNLVIDHYTASRVEFEHHGDPRPTQWTIGHSITTNGVPNIRVDNAARAFSNYCKCKAGDCISILKDSTYTMEVEIYDEDFNYVRYYGWIYTRKIPNDGYYRILIKRTDDGTITSSDITAFMGQFRYVPQPINHYGSNRMAGYKVNGINHRGWYECPENTIPAYVGSYQQGFAYVETDIRKTYDNVMVCLHDATINRTARNADGSELESTINIGDITYEQALQYDFGIYKGEQFAGTKIPKLDEVLNLCKHLGLHLYIDLGATSSSYFTNEDLDKILYILLYTGMNDNATIVCDYNSGQYIVTKNPSLRIGLLYDATVPEQAYSLLTGENTAFLYALYGSVNTERIYNCQAYNIPLEIYIVDDTSYIDAMNSYITGVATNLINVTKYLEEKDNPVNEMGVTLNRAENVEGGYVVKDGVVYVDCEFDSNHSATTTAQIFHSVPAPKNGSAVLNCVSIVDDNIALAACWVLNNTIEINDITSNVHYRITGSYIIE